MRKVTIVKIAFQQRGLNTLRWKEAYSDEATLSKEDRLSSEKGVF